jgi:hypothetical protein
MARQAGINRDLLAMALLGYEAQKRWINAAISDIQAQLGQRGPSRPRVAPDGAAPAKRTMSAAGRRRTARARPNLLPRKSGSSVLLVARLSLRQLARMGGFLEGWGEEGEGGGEQNCCRVDATSRFLVPSWQELQD